MYVCNAFYFCSAKDRTLLQGEISMKYTKYAKYKTQSIKVVLL